MAQEPSSGTPTYGDVKQRLDQYLGETANQLPDIQKSLSYLEQRVLDAVETIEALRSENEAQRQEIKGLEDEISRISAERGAAMRDQATRIEDLSRSLTEERSRTKALEEDLAAAVSTRDSLTAQVATLKQEMENVVTRADALKDELSKRIAELESALAERAAEADGLRAALRKAEADLARAAERRENLQASLASSEAERQSTVKALETRIQELADTLSLERGQTATLRDDLDKARQELSATIGDRSRLTAELGDVRQALDTEKTLSQSAQGKVNLLNRQIAALRDQIAALGEALDASETRNREQKVQIASLGKRLNEALATKVAELARYRSEFFGKLRSVLGDRQDVRIVGDRFVFQSEVLFGSGEAELGADGREQLRRFAMTLREVSDVIPNDVDWILRVDGHTDRRPISTYRFPSNWELSTARAVSVVKFLISEGIPADRLVAAGFGDLHPLDGREDEIAYRRNRRIEFKLTQR